VLVGAQVLLGEEQHHVLEQQFVDDLGVVLGRLAESDAPDLGPQRAREPPHIEVGQRRRCVHGTRAYACVSPRRMCPPAAPSAVRVSFVIVESPTCQCDEGITQPSVK
jgi:hypothetical protein